MKKKGKEMQVVEVCSRHSVQDVARLRQHLLRWYDANKRTLPWRTIAETESDPNRRGYCVWVSEIMLQQTQVATVIDYYNRWIQKWPTMQDLAKASIEEVREVWAGLGYYSRGTRLHQGAQKVVQELDGALPRTAEELVSQLPGVGRYTAGAIASIAYSQVTGLVDGNVSRVLSRLGAVGCDVTTQRATEHFWKLADIIVDPERPGDFNQAMMELGATVCTPKNPACDQCPLREQCQALTQAESDKRRSVAALLPRQQPYTTRDMEDAVEGCTLCFSGEDKWEQSLGVENYPRKGKKKAARKEQTAVCVCQWQSRETSKYLLSQRPATGLLAGLWEFPSLPLDGAQDTVEVTHSELHSRLRDFLSTEHDLEPIADVQYVGQVVHLFSHIHQTYLVYHVTVMATETAPTTGKWLSKEEIVTAAVPTAMKKVFKAFEGHDKKATKTSSKRARNAPSTDTKQRRLDSFFTKLKQP